MKNKLQDRLDLNKGKVSIGKNSFTIKNIEFIEIIKSGANGVVIKGLDCELKRDVAIKIWLKYTVKSKKRIKQGRAESRKIAALDHERIAKIYYSGIYNSLYFLVMEYIKGETLRNVLGKNIDFNIRYNYWYEIVDGIKYAHEQKIFHGDLHSNNILISNNHIKIIDFGTSIFNNHLHSRESVMIESLSQEIFADFSLKEFQDYPFRDLEPQNFLEHCSAWVEILFCIRRLSEETIDDYGLRYHLLAIAIVVSENPLFNIKSLSDKLLTLTQCTDVYVNYFLDTLIADLHGQLNELNTFEQKYYPNETIEFKLKKVVEVKNLIIRMRHNIVLTKAGSH